MLRGEKKASYDAAYGAYMNTQRMISHDGWKLILYPKLNKLRLYHLAKDPLEMENRGAEASMESRKKALFKVLQQEQKRLGDPLDLTEAFPDLAAQ